jgi:hypothetical protein
MKTCNHLNFIHANHAKRVAGPYRPKSTLNRVLSTYATSAKVNSRTETLRKLMSEPGIHQVRFRILSTVEVRIVVFVPFGNCEEPARKTQS